MAIHVCTSNANKLREFERILGVSLTASALDIDEVQSIDTVEVCRRKAMTAFERLGEPVIVDDTGFGLVALKGFPGALVTWALDSGSTSILHRMLPPESDDRAVVITAIGYATSERVEVFVGRLEGRVVPEPRGTNGFGFDEVFVPKGETRTLAEISNTEKDGVSPRGIALRALALHLKNSSSNT